MENPVKAKAFQVLVVLRNLKGIANLPYFRLNLPSVQAGNPRRRSNHHAARSPRLEPPSARRAPSRLISQDSNRLGPPSRKILYLEHLKTERSQLNAFPTAYNPTEKIPINPQEDTRSPVFGGFCVGCAGFSRFFVGLVG